MTKPITGQSTGKKSQSQPFIGKDEMNLAEFPLTRLGTRDQRDVLTYTGWTLDAQKRPCRQVWTVRGSAGLGLPNEFGDRVLLALIYLTFKQGLPKPKVEFSRYQLLKLMGLPTSGNMVYEQLEKTLLQIAGMTVESDQAFYDKTSKERLVTKKAFHVLENLWLRKKKREEYNAKGEHTEGVTGFVVWGSEFWSNLKSGYIKNLDLGFYYSLQTPLARRLYRFLDKRMHHQKTLEIDVFDLAARLGQAAYKKPSAAFRKLEPSIKELIKERYLSKGELVRQGKFSRVRFVRETGDSFARHQVRELEQEQVTQELRTTYQTTEVETQLWAMVCRHLDGQLSAMQQAILVDSSLLSINDNTAVVLTPSAFACQWLRKHKSVVATIEGELGKLTGKAKVKIEFLEPQSASSGTTVVEAS